MKFFTLTLFLTFGIAAGLRAEDSLTLNAAVRQALYHHPQLQAARMEIDAAEARLIDAGKLPNPELELSARRSQAEGSDREGSLFAGLNQRFPITDRLRQSRQVREIDIELARAEVRDAERQFIGKIQEQFVRTLTAAAKIDVLGDLESRTTDYIELAEQRLAQAQGSELDVASAKTELLLARQAKEKAVSELREARAALRPLLGLKPDAPLNLGGSPESATDTLQSTVRLVVPETVNRTDVRSARLRRQRAEAERRLAHAERWEDWEVSIGYENERSVDEPFAAEPDHFFGIGLRIPLPLRNKGEGRTAEAQAELEKSDKLLEATHAATLAEVAREIEAVRKARAAVTSLAKEIIPLIEERESKTQAAYAQGVIDFTPVLQLQQQQARLRETLLETRLEHALSLVRLQTALGSHPYLQSQASK